MDTQKTLIGFGHCAINSIFLELSRRQNLDADLAKRYKSHWWYFAQRQLTNDFFFTNHQHCILFSDDPNHPVEKRALEWDLDDFSPADLSKEIPGRSPRLQIPAADHSKDHIYIYGPIVYEFDLLLHALSFLMQDKRLPSYSLLKDITQYHYAPLFSLIHELKARKINVILVEGARHFNVPYSRKVHYHPVINDEDDRRRLKTVINKTRGMLKDEFRKFGFPLIEVPEHTIDENGCMKEEYRHKEGDNRHANNVYSNIMLDLLLDLIESEPFSKEAGGPTPKIFMPQPWRPQHPILQHITPDPARDGLLALQKARDASHSRLSKKLATLKKDNKLRSNSLEAQLSVCREQIRNLEQMVQQQQQMRQRLKKTLSWRITAPLRMLGRLFKRQKKQIT